MSKHFCCCIPVRFGVFILSLLTLLGAAATAFAAFWIIANGAQANVEIEGGLRIGFIVTGVVYSLFGVISLVGLFGAIFRKRALVKTYSIFLWIQLVVSLGVAVFLGVALFKGSLRQTIIDECVARSQQLQNTLEDATANIPNSTATKASADDLKRACESVWSGGRVGFIIGYVVGFLINLYCCIIVHRYGTQLTEEALSDKAGLGNHHQMAPSHYAQDKNAASAYYPHTPLSHAEQGNAGYQYPYAQPEHRFGGH